MFDPPFACILFCSTWTTRCLVRCLVRCRTVSYDVLCNVIFVWFHVVLYFHDGGTPFCSDARCRGFQVRLLANVVFFFVYGDLLYVAFLVGVLSECGFVD